MMTNVEWEWSNLPDSSIHSGLDESDRNNFSYHEHHLTITELLNSYNYENFDTDHIESCPGLSSISIQIFQNQYGKNILTPPIKNSDFIIFLKQFLNLFMVLLLMAAGLSVLAWGLEPLPRDNLDLYLGLFLVVIVILNCYSTFKQEMKSEKLMEQFRAMLPASQTVMRYGKSKTIDATDLVNGDCILIRAGDKIPADCRVIKCDQLRIDQSMITGEVEPIEATVDSCNTSHLESRNLVFSGSLVVEGNGMCIVIRIGDRTMLGGMIAMSGDLSKDKGGTLKKEIDDFIWIVVKLALIMATVIFAIGILRDLSIFETLVDGFIVTVIANIPVGLPATITTSLLIVAERMKKQNVFIKRLSSIETLGCCNVILTDKTGTLTENKMTVSHLWCSVDWDNAQLANSYKEMHRFHDLNIQQHTENGKQINKAIYDTFCKVAVLNSSVFLTSKESLGHGANANSGQFHSPRRASAFLEESGNPTEVAIYRYFKDILKESLRPEDIEEYRTRGVVREWDVPFSSNTKWQMAYHSIIEETNDSIAQNTGIITLKGAPDIVLTKCSSYLSDKGGTCSIDDLFYSKVKDMIVHLGHRGERAIAFAMKNIVSSKKLDKHSAPLLVDFCFVGIISLRDPPRPEVPSAIQQCRTAGIRVMMVTGDHASTAVSIAKSIGLLTYPTKDEIANTRKCLPSEVPEVEVKAIVLSGNALINLTDFEWEQVIQKEQVIFSRTTPAQKLTIVNKFLQGGDNIVAMTGDGVNDAPALKQASIGVAMGISGSDVAREAADIVLLDDNFASIVTSIKEGRLLFDNLKKSVAYTVSHLLPEVGCVILHFVLGYPLGLSAVLALSIDLVTELLPAMSLAYEFPEESIMRRPPRNLKRDRLVAPSLLLYGYGIMGVIEFGCCFVIYLLSFQFYGVPLSDIMFTGHIYFQNDSPDLFVNRENVHDEVLQQGGISVSYDDSANMYANARYYYNTAQQMNILERVQSSYFLGIVFLQAIHIFQVRLQFTRGCTADLLNNPRCIMGTLVAICLGLSIVYVPYFQNHLFQTQHCIPLALMYGVAGGGVLIIIYSDFRKYISRVYDSNTFIYKALTW